MPHVARCTIAAVFLVSTVAVAAPETAKWPGPKSWDVNPTLNERFTIFGGAAFKNKYDIDYYGPFVYMSLGF